MKRLGVLSIHFTLCKLVIGVRNTKIAPLSTKFAVLNYQIALRNTKIAPKNSLIPALDSNCPLWSTFVGVRNSKLPFGGPICCSEGQYLIISKLLKSHFFNSLLYFFGIERIAGRGLHRFDLDKLKSQDEGVGLPGDMVADNEGDRFAQNLKIHKILTACG